MNDLDFIMAYEAGDITEADDIIAGFQSLIDSGLVWSLQGHYGRIAEHLINCGHCHLPVAATDEKQPPLNRP